jgi:WD40 repeat protein
MKMFRLSVAIVVSATQLVAYALADDHLELSPSFQFEGEFVIRQMAVANSSLLVSDGANLVIRDKSTGKKVASIGGHRESITALCLIGDKSAATGGLDGEVRLHDLDGRRSRPLFSFDRAVELVGYHAGRNEMVCGDVRGNYTVINLATMKPNVSFHLEAPLQVVSVAARDLLVLRSIVPTNKEGSSLEVYKATDGSLISRKELDFEVTSMCAVGENGMLIGGRSTGKVMMVDLPSLKEKWQTQIGSSPVQALGYLKGLDVAVAGCGDGTVSLVSIKTKIVVAKKRDHERGITNILAIGGNKIAISDSNAKVIVYDVKPKSP